MSIMNTVNIKPIPTIEVGTKVYGFYPSSHTYTVNTVVKIINNILVLDSGKQIVGKHYEAGHFAGSVYWAVVDTITNEFIYPDIPQYHNDIKRNIKNTNKLNDKRSMLISFMTEYFTLEFRELNNMNVSECIELVERLDIMGDYYKYKEKQEN